MIRAGGLDSAPPICTSAALRKVPILQGVSNGMGKVTGKKGKAL
jgi:hypothetical protein